MTSPVAGRRYDAALHLLDRQLVDAEGRLIGKVDDLELAVDESGALIVTGILIGPGALAPRLGGRIGEWTVAVWRRLHRDVEPAPRRVPMADVVAIDNAVHVGRGLPKSDGEVWVRSMSSDESREPDVAGPDVHRVSSLIGSAVVTIEGEAVGIVKDVRLAPTAAVTGLRAQLVVAGFVVGQRHTGAFLGYDRQHEQGPWIVRSMVRWLQRDSGYLGADVINDIDWSSGVVYTSTKELEPLTHVND